jgi:hypothetical protein
MKFEITSAFSEKVFTKVGKLVKEDMDFYSLDTQVQFSRGFVDYMHKEAKLTPEMALGVIEYFSDFGSNWLVENNFFTKEAAEGFNLGEATRRAKDRLFSGIANVTKPIWEPTAREAGYDGIKQNFGTFLNSAKNTATEYGGKAWSYLKSPEFLNNVAPLLVGGLIGGLAPKAFGGGIISSGVGAAGGALLGKYLMDNRQEIGSKGKVFLDQMRKELSETFKSAPVNTEPSMNFMGPAPGISIMTRQ